MSIRSKKKINNNSPYGFTIIEVMVSALMITFILSFVVYLMIYNGKSQNILFSQITKQYSAVQAAQSISDLIRNADWSTINVTEGGKTIEFQTVELPASQTCQIRLNGSKVEYDEDKNNASNDIRTVARNIENLTFNKVDSDQIVEVSVSFLYRKYRGYNTTNADKLNGTFVTHIYPRND